MGDSAPRVIPGAGRPSYSPRSVVLPNEYSSRWFRTFLDRIPEERTRAETAFLRRYLPLPHFPRILDVACGTGRHAFPLAEVGYNVTGVDADGAAVGTARERARGAEAGRVAGGAGRAGSGARQGGLPEVRDSLDVGPGTVRFLRGDMRELGHLGEGFDGVLSLWQSFGYFDAETNRAVLRGFRDRLRPGGRLVLDLYNRRFFENRGVSAGQGKRDQEEGDAGASGAVQEHIRLEGTRLTVELRYREPAGLERFEWEIFTADELDAVAVQTGLAPLSRCCDFDHARPLRDDMPRMQMVYERRG